MSIENNRFKSRQEAHSYLRQLPKPRRVIHDTAIIEHTRLGQRIGIGAYSVIGSEGFGFDPESNFTQRWPHLGNVVLGDDVEIGGGCHVDRAVMGSTVIRDNTKLDNLVHVAHNCIIGSNCILTAGVIVGGSVKIGKNVFVGLNATLKDHISVGSNCVIGCGANVISDIPDNSVAVGNPAKVVRQVRAGDPLQRVPA